ncbi:MAG: hypothetical protein SF182_06135 [Deltaproteobacteria bacterium]|nr:hypothetical protein [Deltaproteobacteria bacterium]
MHVLATRLSATLSITLIDDGRGWRFSAWSALANHSLPLPPRAEARQRRFARVADALAFFRRYAGG